MPTLFKWPVNWQEPISVSPQWQTFIEESLSGSEYRTGVSSHELVDFEFLVTAMSAAEAEALRLYLQTLDIEQTWLSLPLIDTVALDRDHLAGSAVLWLDSYGLLKDSASWLMLQAPGVETDEGAEFVNVLAWFNNAVGANVKNPDNATAPSGLIQAWPHFTQVTAVAPGYLVGRPEIQRVTDEHFFAKVHWRARTLLTEGEVSADAFIISEPVPDITMQPTAIDPGYTPPSVATPVYVAPTVTSPPSLPGTVYLALLGTTPVSGDVWSCPVVVAQSRQLSGDSAYYTLRMAVSMYCEGTTYAGLGVDEDGSGIFYGPVSSDSWDLNTLTLEQCVELGATLSSGSATVLVSSTAALDVGMQVFGPGMPAGATISSITDSTHYVLSVVATASFTSGSPLSLSSNTTLNSKTVTMTSTAGLVVGMFVSGPGVLLNTTISAISGDGVTLTLSDFAYATATVTLTYSNKLRHKNRWGMNHFAPSSPFERRRYEFEITVRGNALLSFALDSRNLVMFGSMQEAEIEFLSVTEA